MRMAGSSLYTEREKRQHFGWHLIARWHSLFGVSKEEFYEGLYKLEGA